MVRVQLQRGADPPRTLRNCTSRAQNPALLVGLAGTSSATRPLPTPVPTENLVLENTYLSPKNKLPCLRPQARAPVRPRAAAHAERPPGLWLGGPGHASVQTQGARRRSRGAYQRLSGSRPRGLRRARRCSRQRRGVGSRQALVPIAPAGLPSAPGRAAALGPAAPRPGLPGRPLPPNPRLEGGSLRGFPAALPARARALRTTPAGARTARGRGARGTRRERARARP